MKDYYMIEFDLPEILAEEFLMKIPQQRKIVNNLMSKGLIKSYALSLNRSRIWMVLSVSSEFEAMEIISDLPLSEFMLPSISPLMFHNAEESVHAFSLN